MLLESGRALVKFLKKKFYNIIIIIMVVRFATKTRGGKKAVMRLAGGHRGKRVPQKAVTVAKYINKLINKKFETKYVANSYSDDTHPFAANWFAPVNLTAIGNYHPALPAMAQGVGDYQRIGARVSPVKCFTDLTVGFSNTDISCNEIMCCIYYGTSKAGKTWQSTTPIQSAGDLLDDGDGTTSAFSGTKADLLQPINKHMYNAKRIMFKLSKVAGVLNQYAPTPAGLNPGALATSNGPSFKTVRLNFKTPKTLQYDQTAHSWPSNFAPWFAISFTRVDDVLNTDMSNIVNVSSLSHLYFKDA